jgi:hypothetical protein
LKAGFFAVFVRAFDARQYLMTICDDQNPLAAIRMSR